MVDLKRDMLTPLLFIYGLAFLQPLFHPFDRKRIGWLLALLPFFLTLHFIDYIEPLAQGERPLEFYSWVPSMGLNLSFFLDPLSLLFALLITGIGTLVLIFSGEYLGNEPEQTRFFAVLLLFMGSMLGMILSNNLILLFVFWELTSFASYLLIGYYHEKQAAREAALQAFVITTLGGLALLVAVILLGQVVGSYELSEVLKQKELLQASPKYPVILTLMVLGSFTKSAQIPFHFWLPSAMQAPTPVSAYLHSATLVNAGVYLLSRFAPALGGTELWFWFLVTAGGGTLIYGAWMALFQHDLKLILAYSTLSVLGALFFLLGLGGDAAIGAMLLLLFAHALYKAALFLVAGVIDHQMKTRDLTRLAGLAKKMPWVAFAAALSSLSFIGLPPFLGFWAKEGVYSALLGREGGVPLFIFIMSANVLLVASGLLVGFYPFWHQFKQHAGPRHLRGLGFLLGPLLLALFGLFYGVVESDLPQKLFNPAGLAMGQAGTAVQIGHWQGGTELFFSALTLLLGGCVFVWRVNYLSFRPHLGPLAALTPQRLYFTGFQYLKRFALWLTEHIQNGYLRFYLFVFFLALLLLEGWAWLRLSGDIQLDLSGIRGWDWAIAFLIASASLATLFVRRFLFAILSLSVVGVGVIFLFALNGAPDLACTQILVEAQLLVLLVLLLSKLPRYSKVSSFWVHLRDGILSAAFGGLITLILLQAKREQHFSSISGYFKAHALDLGKGANMVNVILVDFRGLDTLGEITVLTVAGIGVFSLLKLKIK